MKSKLLTSREIGILTEGLLRLSERKAVLFEMNVPYMSSQMRFVRRINQYLYSVNKSDWYEALPNPSRKTRVIVQRKEQ